MSKKFKIPSINIRSHLSSLFHDFMERKCKYEHNHMSQYDNLDDEELMWLMHQQGYLVRGIDDMDDEFDYGNYYDYDDDDDAVIWPPKSSSKKKNHKSSKKDDAYINFWEDESKRSKRKHSKHKKARLIDINCPYSGMEDNPDEEGYSDYEEMCDDDGIFVGKEIYYYPDYHNKDNRLEFKSLKSFNDFCEENGYSVPEHIFNKIAYNRISHTCLRPDAREYGMYEIMCEDSYGTMFYEVCEESELGN